MSRKQESTEEVKRWFTEQIASLWPAALGSLSRRRTPCIRERCSACERGEHHPSFVLFGRVKQRRFGLYIPEELTPELERALEKGRRLQGLLYEAAHRYAQALKRERKHRRRSPRRGGKEVAGA
ncbi:MAG: hypothetical protein ACE5E0_04455 [Terriglobia bacterium]